MKVKILFPFFIVLLLGLSPTDLSMRQALACLQYQRLCPAGQNEISAYKEILRMEPWRVELWEELALAQARRENWDAAAAAFEAALSHEALSLAGRHAYGEVLLRANREEEALRWALTGQADAELLADLYHRLLSALRVEEASQVLALWLKQAENDPQAQLQAGLLALLSAPDGAAVYFARARELDPAWSPVINGLQRAQAQAALTGDPAYQQLLLGREAANHGFTIHAELFCAQALRLNPAYVEAWALLGEMQQRNGRDGLPALLQALALDADNLLARSLLALYWQRSDDPQQAVTAFQRLRQDHPDQLIWKLELGKALALAGDIPAGLEQMLQTVQEHPDDWQAWEALANFCAEFRIELKAYGLPAARSALRLAPGEATALAAMGNVLFTLDDLQVARRYYLRALQADPAEISALYQLGMIALRQGDENQASDYFQNVLEKAPPYSVHAELARRLLDER